VLHKRFQTQFRITPSIVLYIPYSIRAKPWDLMQKPSISTFVHYGTVVKDSVTHLLWAWHLTFILSSLWFVFAILQA